MVQRPRRKARNAFHHPDETEVSYAAMLDAMAACRREVQAFQARCGQRNPAYEEARALIERIDAVARLTRVPGAIDLVQRGDPSKKPTW